MIKITPRVFVLPLIALTIIACLPRSFADRALPTGQVALVAGVAVIR